MATGAAQTQRRPGPGPQVREITVSADEGQLGRVRDFIVEVCSQAGLAPRETSNTKLAVDEACTNIIKHAYDGGQGAGEIKVRVEITAGEVTITLQDQGKRFDFSSIEDPDLDQYVETGRKGGLGVFLINRLMDDVHYESSGRINELVLTKRTETSRSALAIEQRPIRSTLRFKFTMRAGAGLFLLMAVLWGFVFVRQTSDITSQMTGRWVESRRLAENLSNRSVDLLMQPDRELSVQQTNMTSYLSKLLASSRELAYVRVSDTDGQIVSSGTIDELFTPYREPVGEVLLNEGGRMVWKSSEVNGRAVRDIRSAVRLNNPETGQIARLGFVHVGIYQDAIAASVEDTRLATSLLLVAVFLVGVLLIIGLVQVFVRPIQLLTDGVRAIGDGNLEGKLDVQGPAEIGAIASVFNEITDKFKVAQDSILEQEKMQKEMEVAKEIQHSLLPNHKPEVSGYDIAPLYQAAAEVGGDYYDFVQVDEDTIGVVVADVSGKGVPGSLVMTMIRTALRMEARGNKNASDVMAKMNAFVTDDMKKGMFVTMFYVIVDSQNRTISYASAGHNPMVLFRAETNETFFLNPKGFPVGISLPDEELFRKSISLEKIKLKKDDMLLIYTDGVTEAMNAQRDQYGEERMLHAIKTWGHATPEEFIEKLDADIRKFTAGHPQNDDITVVAIKEKLQADDVLFGIRKKLIDLVEVQGLSVKEACLQMRVSPATYYRYKKRLELMGERGLHNKVLRKDSTINRLSLEARKEVLVIMTANPGFGAKRLADEYNAGRPKEQHVTDRMVYDELRRLNLNTRELRLEYLRRGGLIERVGEEAVTGVPAVDAAIRRDSRELVEDLLKDIPGVELEQVDPAAAGESPPPPAEKAELDKVLDMEGGEGAGISSQVTGDITELRVDGHVDSVSSADLDARLRALIDEGAERIIVDLSDVTYISSGGWGIFAGEVGTLRERGGDVVLVGMTSEVYDVYELLGFADVIRAFARLEEARAFLEKPAEERESVPSPESAPVSDEGLPEVEEGLADDSYVPEWESLKIEATTVGTSGDIAVLSLRGIIDTVSAENLRSALGSVVGGGINKVVVDMSGVEYVSSGGWGTFTERLREVRRDGGDIKLFGMDPDVYYVFTMLGFNIVLSSFDILTQAIEDFESGASEKADPSVMGAQPALEAIEEPETLIEPEPMVDDVLSDEVVDLPAPEPPQEIVVDDVLSDEVVDTPAPEPPQEVVVDEELASDTVEVLEPETPVSVSEEMAPVDEVEGALPEVTLESSPEADEPVELVEVREAHEVHDVHDVHVVQEDVTDSEPVPEVERFSREGSESVVEWENAGDGIFVARLHGAVESMTIGDLEGSLFTVLAAQPRAVLFNFFDVPYASSAGWGQVAACYQAAHAWGGVVAVFGLNPDLYDIYSRLEFHELAHAYANEADALREVHASVDNVLPSADAPQLEAAPETIAEATDYATDAPPDTADVDESPVIAHDETPLLESATEPVAEPVDDVQPSVPVDDALGGFSSNEPVVERPREPFDDEPVPQDPSPLDTPATSDNVDVDSAVVDKNVDRDRKLRDIGWNEYGERLRRARDRENKNDK